MNPVVLCIGSEKICGDSLGPAVGTILKNRYGVNAWVYGAEGSSVQAINLGETLEFIERVHAGQPVLAVDACLGKREDVGRVVIRSGGVRAGRATKKLLPVAGDLSILGIVAENSEAPLQSLMTVSALDIANMADKIANVLASTLELLQTPSEIIVCES